MVAIVILNSSYRKQNKETVARLRTARTAVLTKTAAVRVKTAAPRMVAATVP